LLEDMDVLALELDELVFSAFLNTVRKPGNEAHSVSNIAESECQLMTVSRRPSRNLPYLRASLSVRLAIEYEISENI